MSKINQLFLEWPKGTIKSSLELRELGYSSQLLKIYANSQWINLLGRGAYKLSDDNVDWQGGLYCLQRRAENRIHVGAKTALTLKGYTHYVAQEQNAIELFGNTTDTLPAWFTKQIWMEKIKFFSTNAFQYDNLKVFSTIDLNNIPIMISSAELAILEMLFLVPVVHSFNEANLIMEILTSLRVEMVQFILESCSSIKAKRLFLYLGEKHNHSWFSQINQTNIDLGSGKREIVKKGKLNKKYNITVPVDYEE